MDPLSRETRLGYRLVARGSPLQAAHASHRWACPLVLLSRWRRDALHAAYQSCIGPTGSGLVHEERFMVACESVHSPFRPRWAKALVFVGVVVVGAYAYQWTSVYSPERDRVRQSLRSAQEALETVRIVSERTSEFTDDYLKHERELEELDRSLPTVSTLLLFGGELDSLAKESGVRVRGRPVPMLEETFDLYWRHRLSVELVGSETAIQALRTRLGEKRPLVGWIDEGETSDGRNVSLVLWSRSESCRHYESPCRMRDAPWLLWPFSEWIAELRRELDTSCITVEKARVLLEHMNRLQVMTEDIARSRAIIARIEQEASRAEAE